MADNDEMKRWDSSGVLSSRLLSTPQMRLMRSALAFTPHGAFFFAFFPDRKTVSQV